METKNKQEVNPSSFLLIKTRGNTLDLEKYIKKSELVQWASAVFGPYQLVVYLEAKKERDLILFIESLRSDDRITELDARIVKILPQDIELIPFKKICKETAVLLINVDYKEEKERQVTYNLRKVEGVKWARAMWGPSDIIAIVEAPDHESMRNLICDDVKTMKGVKTNTTLYSYPEESNE